MLGNIKNLINTKITLEESTHSYGLDNYPDLEFTSVTKIVDSQFPPFEKEKIAKSLTRRVPKYQHLTWEELVQEWNDIRDHGTAVHKELENYVKHGKSPSLNKAIWGKNCFEDKIKGFGDKIFSEVIVYSNELKIAGTVDLIVYDSEMNECYIFDWKTSKKIDHSYKKKAITSACNGLTDSKIDQYSVQLSMYAYLLEEFHGIPIKEHYIIHLLDNSYKVIKGKYLRKNVELILKSYHGFDKFRNGLLSICPYNDCDNELSIDTSLSKKPSMHIKKECPHCGRYVFYVYDLYDESGLITENKHKDIFHYD